MKKITILALLLTWGTATWAEENENQKTEEHKQVEESKRTSWNKYLHGYQYQARVAYNIGGTAPIGLPATIRTLHSYTLQPNFSLGIDALRDDWYKTSYLLDRKQSMNGMAKKRYTNYKKQPIEMNLLRRES